MIREPLAADLLGAAAFAHRVDQLDTVGVNDPQHRRGGQEALGPVLMRHEEAQEPGALGELGKQRPRVAREPTIQRPVASAFEGMEQPQGDHLTGPEAGVEVFGDGAHLLIDLIEQRGDKIMESKDSALLHCGSRFPSSAPRTGQARFRASGVPIPAGISSIFAFILTFRYGSLLLPVRFSSARNF